MSSHDNHHAQETKTIAFGTPLILGLVTLLVIILLVSTCDTKHEQTKEHSASESTHTPTKH